MTIKLSKRNRLKISVQKELWVWTSALCFMFYQWDRYISLNENNRLFFYEAGGHCNVGSQVWSVAYACEVHVQAWFLFLRISLFYDKQYPLKR